MPHKLEYLSIPVDVTTKLELPYIIYESDEYQIVLKQFTEQDLEKAFRLRFETGDRPNVYKPIFIDHSDNFGDDNISLTLHGIQLQLCAIPKSGLVDETVRERISIGLECAIGFLDEHVSWVYDDGPSSIQSRGVHRSHRSARSLGAFGEKEAEIMQSVLAYEDSEYLPQHKFDTLRALLNAARHQAGASDVACVLYFSVLEAIFVADNKELSYKLSMRLARYRNEDFDYAKRITKLYDKRGKVIHGSNKGNFFTEEEYLLIESLAKDAFVDMLVDPEAFTADRLDQSLLVPRR